MLAHTVRSGLIESIHRGSIAAVDASGSVLFELGAPDRPIFYRSAIKPLQAVVALEQGVDFSDEELAVTCASHDGLPVHEAMVNKILADCGLDESALQTPPDWPMGEAARARVLRAGNVEKRRIWHNCSGKHAGWLATCVRAGWDPTTYREPNHPLQRRVVEIVGDATGIDPTPVGIDGCGAPVLRGNVLGLARAFAQLSSDPSYERVSRAVHRFPALVGGDRPESRLAAWWDGPVKAGAEGLIGAGRHGIGVAVRSESGSGRVALIGLVAAARHLGLLSEAALEAVAAIASPPVLGHGKQVGAIEPVAMQ